MYKARPIEVAIEIPSGQIVFDDDLRFAYPIPKDKEHPPMAHGPLWQKIITESYGEVGLFHGYVGNSCPSIHNHNGSLIIGNPSYDSKSYESRDDLPGRSVGSVCTDLWWYSIADAEDFTKRVRNGPANKKKQDAILRNVGRAEIKPGRYVLRHYYPYFGKSRIKHGKAEIYATLQSSNKEIKPYLLPDEGIVEMLIMKYPELQYACVEFDKDRLDEIDADERLIFAYYQILMDWKMPDIGTIFATPKFTGDELQDHELVCRRSLEHRNEAIAEQVEHNQRMKEHEKRMAAMTPEERATHEKQMNKVFKEILKEIKEEETYKEGRERNEIEAIGINNFIKSKSIVKEIKEEEKPEAANNGG